MYFSASTNAGGSNPSTTNVTTAKLGDTTFTLTNDSAWTKTKLDYPGGIAIMRTTATAKLEDTSTTSNTYTVKYKLKLSGKSEITTLKWHLYELEASTQESLDAALGSKFGIDSCKLVVDSSTTGETHLYYTSDGTKEGQSCDVTNLGITTQLGEYEIASGAFNATELTDDNSHKEEEITDLNNIERKIENVTKGQEVKKYYYLVVEYPNNTSDQSTDEGKKIDIQLELVSDSVSVELANQ